MDTISQKRCNKCGETKSTSDFSPNYTACKKCIAAYRRERIKKDPSIVEKTKQWAREHKDKMREYLAKYHDKNRDERNRKKREKRKDPQEKIKVREYNRKYYAVNTEEKRALTKAWRLSNLERDRERMRQWQIANREKVNVYAQNYRARKKGNGGIITVKEWEWLKEFYNYTCLRCGRREPEIKLSLDHIKPISKGGKNVISNAQPLCGSCNTAKKDKTIDYRPHRRLL